ncbi:uncharacterized protein LOC143918369 isoform X2 [Arctopsyche grandis]|uniref:uncharacterized protein LOC143918369 isoform X2 n=1 Tax=Arctopsyche grandis TaxID=121162 RepID=UPI00406D9670
MESYQLACIYIKTEKTENDDRDNFEIINIKKETIEDFNFNARNEHTSNLNTNKVKKEKQNIYGYIQRSDDTLTEEMIQYLNSKTSSIERLSKRMDEFQFQTENAGPSSCDESDEYPTSNHKINVKKETNENMYNVTDNNMLILPDESIYIDPIIKDELLEDPLLNKVNYDGVKIEKLTDDLVYEKYMQNNIELVENMIQKKELKKRYMAEKRRNQTEVEKRLDLEKGRLRKKMSRYNETPEKRNLRLDREREYKFQKRKNLSPEEKERELIKNRIYKRLYREYESPEKRKIRLDRDRIRKSQKRLEQKLYLGDNQKTEQKMYIENGEKLDNMYVKPQLA